MYSHSQHNCSVVIWKKICVHSLKKFSSICFTKDKLWALIFIVHSWNCNNCLFRIVQVKCVVQEGQTDRHFLWNPWVQALELWFELSETLCTGNGNSCSLWRGFKETVSSLKTWKGTGKWSLARNAPRQRGKVIVSSL